MLTLQYIPHFEVGNLDSDTKIKKLLKIVKENKIILLEGRLKVEEEAQLIQKTMEIIDKDFKGIEISTIDPKRNNILFDNIKKLLAKFLLGSSGGLTIIGPATIVKEIKKDPNKIELLTNEVKRGRKK